MFDYWFVGYAILNKDWIEKHGNQWRTGRIEVCSDEGGFPINEISITYNQDNMLKQMKELKVEPNFEDWIDSMVSEKELDLKSLIEHYKKDTGIKLVLFSES